MNIQCFHFKVTFLLAIFKPGFQHMWIQLAYFKSRFWILYLKRLHFCADFLSLEMAFDKTIQNKFNKPIILL